MGIVLQGSSDLSGALVTTLGVVALFALGGFVLVRVLSGRGLRVGRGKQAQLEVVERLPLDFKSSLYVVRGMGRTWLVGCGDGSSPRLLTELDPHAAAPVADAAGDGDG